MNTFILICALLLLALIGMMIALFETKKWIKGRNTLLIMLFCIGLIPGILNPESMTGVAYQLPCVIVGLLVGFTLPDNKHQ